jgi:hypothetical protein
MSLLVILGGGLVALLGQCVRLWNTAENRGKVYEEARALLDRIAEDLRSTVIRAHASEGDGWVRFLADMDPQGRQRLRFVRSVSGEAADAILREGGRLLSVRTPAVADGQGDAKEAQAGLLAAPGGLMEVLYATDSRPGFRSVWRGTRSPVGGPDSLFRDEVIESGAPQEGAKSSRARASATPRAAPTSAAAPQGANGSAQGVAEAAGADALSPPPAPALEGIAAPIADNILYLGFSFWTGTTNTWRPVPTLESPRGGEASGPSFLWDSTRALLDTDGAPGEFHWKRRPGSLDDPRDDVFPERVEVTVVVGPPSTSSAQVLSVRLVEELNEGGKQLSLSREIELAEDTAARFVLVDDEWIEIESVSGTKLSVAAQGRGARGTKASKHDRGARVETGTTFSRVVEIPGFRTEIRADGDRRSGRGSRGGLRR